MLGWATAQRRNFESEGVDSQPSSTPRLERDPDLYTSGYKLEASTRSHKHEAFHESLREL